MKNLLLSLVLLLPAIGFAQDDGELIQIQPDPAQIRNPDLKVFDNYDDYIKEDPHLAGEVPQSNHFDPDYKVHIGHESGYYTLEPYVIANRVYYVTLQERPIMVEEPDTSEWPEHVLDAAFNYLFKKGIQTKLELMQRYEPHILEDVRE